jgi:heme A synthase
MRLLLLAVVVVFTAALGMLTVVDMVNNGVTWLDVLAILVIVLFGIGIVGSLLQRPRN